MTPLRFIELASTQPEVSDDRNVRVPGPELMALIQSGRPPLLSEINAHLDQRQVWCRFRCGHILGPGLSTEAISAWQSLHPDLPQSADITDWLAQIDGIHLWADLDTGLRYFGIRPLSEWRRALDDDSVILFDEQPRDTLVISYHTNGDYFLLLQASENRFTWFDPQSPDDSEVIGSSVSDLLNWWWDRVEEMDPRTATT